MIHSPSSTFVKNDFPLWIFLILDIQLVIIKPRSTLRTNL
jgi:hypothetical protein